MPVMAPPVSCTAPTVSELAPSAKVPAVTVKAPELARTLEAPSVSVPPLRIVPPSYVLAPDSVSEPAPALVSEKPPPPMTPPSVSVLAETVIVRFAPSVIAPVPCVRFAVPTKVKSDDSVRTLLMLTALAASRLPPFTVTVVPLPNAFAEPAESVPAESVVLPKALLAPDSVSLPAPSFVRPAPVTVLLRTTSEAVVSERVETPVATVPLMVRVPLLTASPRVAEELSVSAFVSERAVVLLDDSVVPDDIERPAEPRTLLAPTWIVPALSVVVPVRELLAFVSKRTPAPLLVIEAPDRIELIVAVKPEPTTSDGEPPESVSVPLLSVVFALNVTEFA